MEQRWATIVMNVPCIFLFQTSWDVTWTTRPPQSSRSTLEATTAPCSAQASVSASVVTCLSVSLPCVLANSASLPRRPTPPSESNRMIMCCVPFTAEGEKGGSVRRFQSTSSKRVKPPHNCPFSSRNLHVIQGDFRRHRSRHLRCWLVVARSDHDGGLSVSQLSAVVE